MKDRIFKVGASDRHAGDSDDFSTKGMLRDMQRRQEWDLMQMRRREKETVSNDQLGRLIEKARRRGRKSTTLALEELKNLRDVAKWRRDMPQEDPLSEFIVYLEQQIATTAPFSETEACLLKVMAVARRMNGGQK